MKAGHLRDKVMIQYKTGGRDENGYEQPETWVNYFDKPWSAKVVDSSVRDLLAAQAQQAQTRSTCRLRWCDQTANITSDMRLIFDGKVFAIDGPPQRDNVNGRIWCTLLISNGVEKHGG